MALGKTEDKVRRGDRKTQKPITVNNEQQDIVKDDFENSLPNRPNPIH